MTWVHFTSYLDGARPIRKEERDEIYDQVVALFLTVCGRRYTLSASYLATIKASPLLTDRAHLIDTLPFQIVDRLEQVLPHASPGFTNMAAARAAALAAESLTEADMSAIISLSIDSFRLWNFYKRWIDALITSPTAALNPFNRSRTVSASKPKLGYNVFTGSSLKIYRRQELSGSFSVTDAGTTVTNSFGGDIRLTDDDTGGFTDTSFVDISVTGLGNATLDLWFTHPTAGFATRVGYQIVDSAAHPGGELFENNIVSTTPLVIASDTTYGSNVYLTLADEFTDAQIIAKAIAALPAFSGAFSGLFLTASTVLSANGVTATARKMEYKFLLPTLTGYTAYQITWTERFTPVGGGSPTDNNRTYNWDLSAIETGLYVVDAPSAFGTTTIISVIGTATC